MNKINYNGWICKSGLKGWAARLQNVYDSFEEFERHDPIFRLAERLKFKNAADAWKENPVICGSTNVSDYSIINDEGRAWKLFKFKQDVLRPLQDILSQEDSDNFAANDVERFFEQGWTIEDAVAYLLFTEEASPNLEEEIALPRMARIREKYTGQGGKI